MTTESTIVTTAAPGWLRAAVAHATLAPSSHNAQPWRFRVDGDTVELLADRTRRLPVVDPHDRELVIGCGAALLYLRLAIRNAGRRDVVEPFPDPARPDLLARVRVGAAYFPTREEEALFHAMPRRHSHRRPFDARPVGAAMLASLGAAAFVEGAMLDVTHGAAERDALGTLVSAGDRRQAHDPAFRREFAAWLRANDAPAHDGMPCAAFGIGDVASCFTAFVVRRFDWGARQGAKDQALAAHAPALALVSTDDDTPASWLRAGQAVARVLLRATAAGLVASFLNQPIEDPSLRAAVAESFGVSTVPQLLLRLGYPVPLDEEQNVAARRAVDEVLV